MLEVNIEKGMRDGEKIVSQMFAALFKTLLFKGFQRQR